MKKADSLRLPLEYFRAHRHATKAIQRGDIAAAHQWMAIIERMLKIAERENILIFGRPLATPAQTTKPQKKEEVESNPWGEPGPDAYERMMALKAARAQAREQS